MIKYHLEQYLKVPQRN